MSESAVIAYDRLAETKASCIGFFDSGVGGLSVWRETVRLLPGESTLYIADSANCPYGPKPAEAIRGLARRHTAALLAAGAKLIVVACNTATAAAIDALRAENPAVPFVGMEPAVKPAALRSKSGVIGVLATEGTFHGRLYQQTSRQFAAKSTLLMTIADEWVGLVERGQLDTPEAEAAVRRRVEPLLAAGADYLVLGCTHFPFLKPLIERIAAGRAAVLDPSEAVARQVKRILTQRKLLATAGAPVTHRFASTGDAGTLKRIISAAT